MQTASLPVPTSTSLFPGMPVPLLFKHFGPVCAEQEVRPAEGREHTSAFLWTLDGCGVRVQLTPDLTFEVFPNQLRL